MPHRSRTAARNWVLAPVSLAAFMVALDSLVLSTTLSTIRAGLDAPIETLQWAVNAYNLALAVLLMKGAASLLSVLGAVAGLQLPGRRRTPLEAARASS